MPLWGLEDIPALCPLWCMEGITFCQVCHSLQEIGARSTSCPSPAPCPLWGLEDIPALCPPWCMEGITFCQVFHSLQEIGARSTSCPSPARCTLWGLEDILPSPSLTAYLRLGSTKLDTIYHHAQGLDLIWRTLGFGWIGQAVALPYALSMSIAHLNLGSAKDKTIYHPLLAVALNWRMLGFGWIGQAVIPS